MRLCKGAVSLNGKIASVPLSRPVSEQLPAVSVLVILFPDCNVCNPGVRFLFLEQLCFGSGIGDILVGSL